MNEETTSSNNVPPIPEGIVRIVIGDEGQVRGGNILPTFVAPPPPLPPSTDKK